MGAIHTILEVHVAVLVEVVAAHGAVEVVVRVHLDGGVGDGGSRKVGERYFGGLSLLRELF
jgi:hypothetical protein